MYTVLRFCYPLNATLIVPSYMVNNRRIKLEHFDTKFPHHPYTITVSYQLINTNYKTQIKCTKYVLSTPIFLLKLVLLVY